MWGLKLDEPGLAFRDEQFEARIREIRSALRQTLDQFIHSTDDLEPAQFALMELSAEIFERRLQ
jgi:hypothetical protein